jgi:hypothetical protein
LPLALPVIHCIIFYFFVSRHGKYNWIVNNIMVGLLSVPLFKALTGLPPYLGMLAALGTMWSLTDAIHAGEGDSRAVTDSQPTRR